MKKFVAGSISGLLLAIFSTTASATIITVDPDDFAAGTDITNAFAGVTLTAVGGGWNAGPSIFSINPSNELQEPFNASTGVLTFGTNGADFPHLFREPGFLSMRVDFASATDFVSIDYISNDANDVGFLQVFDALDNLLGTYTTASLSTSQFEAMTFASGSANIAYILAGGDSGSSSGGLDNLRFNAVPVPTTLALLGLGAAGIGFQRRRKVA